MALVNTDARQDAQNYQGVSELVRVLRGAVADEMSACNLYSRIIDGISTSKLHGSIIKVLDEIMRDEMQHQGKLITLIAALDNVSKEYMQRGTDGT
jgi:rubrerythrin